MDAADPNARRASVARLFGARGSEVDELLAYNAIGFDLAALAFPLALPVPDEPHVHAWRRYALEIEGAGGDVAGVLSRHLPQLRFPIAAGISEGEPYRQATRLGVDTDRIPEATGLALDEPAALRLRIHDSPAGGVPVLVTSCRPDFVRLVQALSRRNEPIAVPDSMGATFVSGFNNWERIGEHRRRWEAAAGPVATAAAWDEEFTRLRARKELYQDRFIVLSDGPYSAVTADDMGMADATWRELSREIRLEHECAHYFTLRVLKRMQDRLHDELVADYAGIVGATGAYRADWFSKFMGIDEHPRFRAGGRLANYRGVPPLSDGAFLALQGMVAGAARNVETFDRRHSERRSDLEGRALMLLTLCHLSLEELAADGGAERLDAVLDVLWRRQRPE